MSDPLICINCMYRFRMPWRMLKVIAVAETCDVCRFLGKSITVFRDNGHMPELQNASWRLSSRTSLMNHGDIHSRYMVKPEYRLPAQAVEDGMDFIWDRDGVKLRIVRVDLEITTPLDQILPWDGFGNSTDISNYSGSEQCFVKLEGWLEECSKEHWICNEGSVVSASANANAEGPKRLLDTGPLDKNPALMLIDFPSGNGEGVKYCALSYCWGEQEDNYVTTRETYQARRYKISLKELPRMFQDAVFIARRIGCRYLWIDSMCIIQHDRLDWESEAPRMQSIYGNAFLVIAATHCPSPSSGIFSARAPTAYFDFDCVGKTYKISVKERINHDHWTYRNLDHRQSFPLHTRAWAFQERVLAKRIVHYSPFELVWECKTHIRCECSGLESPDESPPYDPGVSLKSEVAEALLMAEKAKHVSAAWQSLIHQYSTKQLTVQNDRLPALSGLARQFAFPQMGKYLAGIWYSQLPHALDWTICDAQNPRDIGRHLGAGHPSKGMLAMTPSMMRL